MSGHLLPHPQGSTPRRMSLSVANATRIDRQMRRSIPYSQEHDVDDRSLEAWLQDVTGHTHRKRGSISVGHHQSIFGSGYHPATSSASTSRRGTLDPNDSTYQMDDHTRHIAEDHPMHIPSDSPLKPKRSVGDGPSAAGSAQSIESHTARSVLLLKRWHDEPQITGKFAIQMCFVFAFLLLLMMLPAIAGQYENGYYFVSSQLHTPALLPFGGSSTYAEVKIETSGAEAVNGSRAELYVSVCSEIHSDHASETEHSDEHSAAADDHGNATLTCSEREVVKLLAGPSTEHAEGEHAEKSLVHKYIASMDLRDLPTEKEHAYVKIETNSEIPIAMQTQVLDLGNLGFAQVVVGLIILCGTFVMILIEYLNRTLVAMLAAGIALMTLACQHRLPEMSEIIEWLDADTLALLFAMMLIVGICTKTGIFHWLAVKVLIISNRSSWKLLVYLCVLDCFMSAFLDNVTTLLILCPVVIQLCKAVGMDPRPFLIPLALFGSIGGTATMIGDPPNIIVGNMIKETNFNDFIVYCAPPAIMAVGPCLLYIKWYNRDLFAVQITADIDAFEGRYRITKPQLLFKCMTVLFSVLLGFFLHPVIHISPTMVALIGAIALLLLHSKDEVEEILHTVEWETLIFFASLFVLTEACAELGVLNAIAEELAEVIEGVPIESRNRVAMLLILWVSALVSAFVDNIPFVTAMVPVVMQLGNVEGLSVKGLAYSLCLGADFGGLGTLIGAGANVVTAGVAEKAGYHISFISFMKVGMPIMLMCVVISTFWLLFLENVGAFPPSATNE